MYIVAIAWLYVTILMALTERSFTAGLMTFLFYGLLPLALFLWLVGTPGRRRAKARRAASMPVRELADEVDHRDAERDERDLGDRRT